MKRYLLILLFFTTAASAQVTLPDSTRQTGGTNFTPQFNYSGTNASTAKLQIYNPLSGKYFGLYSAYQQSQLFPTFTYFNTITGSSTLARINGKADSTRLYSTVLPTYAKKDSALSINKNLFDVPNKTTARNNLGITTLLNGKLDSARNKPILNRHTLQIDTLKGTFKRIIYPDSITFRPFEIYENNGTYTISKNLHDIIQSKAMYMRTYFADYVNGSNSNDGLTWATPVKTITYAFNTLGARKIVVIGHHKSDSFGAITGTGDDLVLIGMPGSLISTATTATPTWTNTGGNVYSTTLASSGNVVDMSRTDRYGVPLILDRKLTLTEMQNTPNSSYITGSTVYVNIPRVPDANINILLTSTKQFRANSGGIMAEDVTFMGGNRGLLVQNNSGTTSSLFGYFNRCKFVGGTSGGSNGEGLRASNAALIWSNECLFYNNRRDGANYRKETGQEVTNACYMIETNSQFFFNGGGVDQTTTVNGSSCHSGINSIRVNNKYYTNVGPNVIDVEGAKSFIVNCSAWDSRGFTTVQPYLDYGDFVACNTSGNGLPTSFYIINSKSYDTRISYGSNSQSYVSIDSASTFKAPFTGTVTIGTYSSGFNSNITPLPIFSTYTDFLNGYAKLSSPIFTGTPAAPTAAAGTNTTQIATTAYVLASSGRLFRYQASGDGVSTTISTPHGLTGITNASKVLIQPMNAVTAGVQYATVDATNIYLTYSVAPAAGTLNLLFTASIAP